MEMGWRFVPVLAWQTRFNGLGEAQQCASNHETKSGLKTGHFSLIG